MRYPVPFRDSSYFFFFASGFAFCQLCPCLSYRGFSLLSLSDFQGVELAHKGSLLVNLPTVPLLSFSFFFLTAAPWLLGNNNETNPSDTPYTLIPRTVHSSGRPLESFTDTNCVFSRVIARQGPRINGPIKIPCSNVFIIPRISTWRTWITGDDFEIAGFQFVQIYSKSLNYLNLWIKLKFEKKG